MLQKTYQIRKKPPGWGKRGLYQAEGFLYRRASCKVFLLLGLCAGTFTNEEHEKLYQALGSGGVIRPCQLPVSDPKPSPYPLPEREGIPRQEPGNQMSALKTAYQIQREPPGRAGRFMNQEMA